MEPPPKSYAEIMAAERQHMMRPRGTGNDDDDELATETSLRAKLGKVLSSSQFDSLMGLVVVANMGVMIAQSNANAPCADGRALSECANIGLASANMVFQVVYTIECGCRLFVERRTFFKVKWNVLDMAIVFTGWIDIIFDNLALSWGPGVSMLRIFRVGRLLRVVRLLSFFPELYLMLRGFSGAMMAMFWGMILILGLLVIWSIIGVELIYPVALKVTWADDSCPTFFSSVHRCLLYFFASVFAGDAWGTCVVPIVVSEWWTFLVFSGSLISIQLGFTNLVLAVIVERATSAQMADAETRHQEKIEKHKQKVLLLKQVLTNIDEDASGSLDVAELRHGYQENKDLALLLGEVDVGEEDLVKMSELLANDDGVARIDEFVDNLERCQSDLPRQILMMNLTIGNIKRTVDAMKDSVGHKKREAKEEPKLDLSPKDVEEFVFGLKSPSSISCPQAPVSRTSTFGTLLPARPTGAEDLVTLLSGLVERLLERESHLKLPGAAPGVEPASSDGVTGSTTDTLTTALQPCLDSEPEAKHTAVGQPTQKVLKELQVERGRFNQLLEDWQTNLDRLLCDLVQGSQTHSQDQASVSHQPSRQPTRLMRFKAVLEQASVLPKQSEAPGSAFDPSLLPAGPTGTGDQMTLVAGRVERSLEREPHLRLPGTALGFEPASSDGATGSTPDALTTALQPCLALNALTAQTGSAADQPSTAIQGVPDAPGTRREKPALKIRHVPRSGRASKVDRGHLGNPTNPENTLEGDPEVLKESAGLTTLGKAETNEEAGSND